MLVEAAPDRCLLARHAGAGPDGYSLLAGFVEVGESLADRGRLTGAQRIRTPTGGPGGPSSRPSVTATRNW
ncbi:hypothetical protein GA0070216_109260 [Micromonospora matsumotoense]|uniref:Uncharacterized protein n=1 Tax=Micromonospora matsumotoense TaxID=121616 RepID=A0A1C4ZI94_9ACTN|nr:hypothetical protein GA0070216_109260 [Micromonospora matsumotoense]